MTEVNDAAIAEIAGRMFDGDLIRQPQRVQDRVWRDARAALFAALAHLTDDGAAVTPPADSTGVGAPAAAESATTTAAPSSPLPCGHEPLVGLYDDTRTLTIQGSINHEVMIKLGDEEAFFTWADSFLATAHCAAYEAGEGATPATTHRPTCGMTYGESCDGYCPTPAIDREALTAALGWVDNALRNGSAMTRANLAFEVLCRQLGVDRDSLNTSDAAIERLRTALTGGAQ